MNIDSKRERKSYERRGKVVKGEDKAFHIYTKEGWKEMYSGMLASTRKRQSQESEMRLLVELRVKIREKETRESRRVATVQSCVCIQRMLRPRAG